MHRVSAISFVLALAAVLLGTKVFGAPTGEDTQNVHLEARDTPQSGPNFEPVQDKPLLVPRAPVPEADADANADADAEADPDIRSHPDQNCPDPRDAGLDLGWPIISCEDGRRKRFLKKDPDADLDSLDDDLAERV
ncbi:hypothetical protein BKA80DRAFT_282624 [Phyllosticta citrichinensis]